MALGAVLLVVGVVLVMAWSGSIPQESVRPTAIPPDYLAPVNLAGTLSLAAGLVLAALLLVFPRHDEPAAPDPS